jgi:superfamily II DNA or RNA helicase
MARARTFAQALKRDVSSTTRARGEHYFLGGRVTLRDSDSTHARATVRGTRSYDVSLRLDGVRLLVECSCPQFEQSAEPCKHVWAVIREVDTRQLFTPPEYVYIDIDENWYDGAPADPSDLDPDASWNDMADRRAEGLPSVASAAASPAAADDRQLSQSDRMKAYWQQRRQQAMPQANPLDPEPWQTLLMYVMPQPSDAGPASRRMKGEIIYVFDIARASSAGAFVVELMTRERKKSGEWAKPKPLSMMRGDIAKLPDEDDRGLLESLAGAASHGNYYYDHSAYTPMSPTFRLTPALQRVLVPRLCATGRFVMRQPKTVAAAGSPSGRPGDATAGSRGSAASDRVPGRPGGAAAAGPGRGPEAAPGGAVAADAGSLIPLAWNPEETTFELRVTGDATQGYSVRGVLNRAGDERPLSDLLFVTRDLMLSRSAEDGTYRFGLLQSGGAERWLATLVRLGTVDVPAKYADTLAEALASAQIPSVACPPELRIESIDEPPQPILRATSWRQRHYYQQQRLLLELSFRYGDLEVDAFSAEPVLIDAASRRSWPRHHKDEQAAMTRIIGLGARHLHDSYTGAPYLELVPKHLPAVARVLITEGWHVEAEGRVHRAPGAVSLAVRSGIDWFELHGGIDFGGITASLPSLLAALKRGESFVTLDDGSIGQLPETWLARSGWIAELGATERGHVRFRRSQAALLDAWLAAQPDVSFDAAFAQARQQLTTFNGIAAVEPPATFHGSLRGYQREALGWFAFLRQFGFGGVLADEMGLGKTVMVLAALDAHRLTAKNRRPSLIVVPRSLVFNWQQEAQRFAPSLRVLDCSGPSRRELFASMGKHDLVLVTYGTLRRDIEQLKDVAFEYVILDEAQAIKNARTNSAVAVRLLQARHRLALSGTPVENHLGELWSLFEFLNPGMLGKAPVFAGATPRTEDAERLAVLARGLRPFILRRTKEQVAKELPSRTEQTLYCDLESAQRAVYDELRAHYQSTLLKRVERDGLSRSKMYVLEALLRLRQAACHPRLIDRKAGEDVSSKFDALVPRLQELAEDGRKALVFSQFTSLLALLRPRLDETGLTYAYLDGRTKDRAARVQEFESSGCPVFLISLKAGGVGLNLTAAEYVFLLDPWWNPAVEAQAIDRTHRIGQTRAVFAYRLIARDTVEEKVLELQATKRRLADAIVRADEGLIRQLRREDLELLLS